MRDAPRTVIGPDVVIRGDIEGRTDLHLQGRVIGKVAVFSVLVDENAMVEGPVLAESIAIAGRVAGSVDAKSVHLKPSARIEGDVTYESLQMDSGARLVGRCAFAEGGVKNIVPFAEPTRDGEAKPESGDPRQELVNLAARLRRTADGRPE